MAHASLHMWLVLSYFIHFYQVRDISVVVDGLWIEADVHAENIYHCGSECESDGRRRP